MSRPLVSIPKSWALGTQFSLSLSSVVALNDSAGATAIIIISQSNSKCCCAKSGTKQSTATESSAATAKAAAATTTAVVAQRSSFTGRQAGFCHWDWFNDLLANDFFADQHIANYGFLTARKS